MDCVTAVFPEASQINAPVFTEVLKKLFTAQFSVKKKFAVKIAPAPGALSVKILDHDGETVIRDLNIPNKTSVTPAQPVNGTIPAVKVTTSPAASQPAVTDPVRPAAPAPHVDAVMPLTPAPAMSPPASQQAPAKKRKLDLDLS